MSTHKYSPSVMCAIAVTAAAALLSGCAAGTEGSAPVGSPDSQRCAQIERIPASPDADLVEVVVDRTSSARSELSLPPRLTATLTAAQQHSDDRGTSLQVISVNGTGAATMPSVVYPLDPMPGDSSPMADDARALALQCAGEWVGRAAAAEGTGTDLVAALATAERQRPARIVVISDGVHATTDLDLNTPPDDPSAAAAHAGRLAPQLVAATTPVTWFDMGERQPPMSQDHRQRLATFWQALLGQRLDIDTRTGSAEG